MKNDKKICIGTLHDVYHIVQFLQTSPERFKLKKI